MPKLWLLAILCFGNAALAEELPFTPEMERRYEALTHELRCVTCNNVSIAESGVLSAVAMKEQVMTLLQEGKTNEEILAIMVKTYGERVRYTPQVSGWQLILLYSPYIALFAGIVILWFKRRRPKPGATDAELEQARAMLDEEQS